MIVRPERAGDAAGIREVHVAAFPTDAEARLVERLRATGNARVSLVAVAAGAVVGHALFSPVVLAASTPAYGLGLAPMAVVPPLQDRGIGSALIRDGIARCRALGVPFVVVLGHPAYYPRFGFERADRLGLRNEYGATDAFMVIGLRAGGIPPAGGLVRYGPEFAEFGQSDE